MRNGPLPVVAIGLAVVAALALQGSLFARLPLPGGTPNLVLVLVVAVGLVGGASTGMLTGFAAGMLADLLSDHPAGVLALCFALAGFMAGLLETDTERSVFRPLFAVATASVGTFLLYLGVFAVLGRAAAAGLADLPSTVVYDVMLTPFVVPVVSAAARRLDPDVR